MKVVAIVLAGGKGSRMKSDVPKQYMELNDKPVLYYALNAFQKSKVDEIILVTGNDEQEYCRREIVDKYHFNKVTDIVVGGKERYNSVMNGLLCSSGNYVLIHDGARPCVTQEIIERCIQDAVVYGACVAAVPVKDTIKVADKDNFAKCTPDRSTLWQIQTPQAFSYEIVKKAYENMINDINRGNITDDAMVVENYSDIKVKMTVGDYNNIKITTPEDLIIADIILKSQK